MKVIGMGVSKFKGILSELKSKMVVVVVTWKGGIAIAKAKYDGVVYKCEFYTASKESAIRQLGLERKTKRERKEETVRARKVTGEKNLKKTLRELKITRDQLGNIESVGLAG